MLCLVILTIFNVCLGEKTDCPGYEIGTPPSGTDTIPSLEVYKAAVQDLDIEAVFDRIIALLSDSQECWPADTFGDAQGYGGLFIRLAWHCSGTFRTSDGLGGCAGGRQRFDPEASWPDNENLDAARALLVPIKQEFGDALSWGDLFVFAGTASIYAMGGPVNEVCAGRIDDNNGDASIPLSDVNDCGGGVDGNCEEPLGASTMGLIYVNPEGIDRVPEPKAAAQSERIREVFSRMGMNDTETVALIGGGHAFGKSHVNTSTIEGQWTTKPLEWDNEYFRFLVDDNYTLIAGPGGAHQWENSENEYLMLTTDLALIYDDDYLDIVIDFADNLESLNVAFAAAWQKLVTQGGEWVDSPVCVDYSKMTISTTEDGDDDDSGESSAVRKVPVLVMFVIAWLSLFFS